MTSTIPSSTSSSSITVTTSKKPSSSRLQRSLSALLTSMEHKDISRPQNNRKTKIVSTVGPQSCSLAVLMDMIRAGMNVARLNCSHGDLPWHATAIQNIREASRLTGIMCAIMIDTKGPEVRTSRVKNGSITLAAGQKLRLVVSAAEDEAFFGDNSTLGIQYPQLKTLLKPGIHVKLDDGFIDCVVDSVNDDGVYVTVNTSANLGDNKTVHFPGVKLDTPYISDKDREDLAFALQHHVDFVTAACVRHASDVSEIRAILGEVGKHVHIIAKIENQSALENFDEILSVSDGVMVARGDLGIETPIQKVCMAQKGIIRKCNIAAKPVITATQMLDSMAQNPRPTRAEATDVANAVFDGTDAVMLSRETAIGLYPAKAVETMHQICKTAELAIDYQAYFESMVHFTRRPLNKAEALTSSAVKVSMDLDSPLILVLSESGVTARYIAKYKPSVPIVVLSTVESTAKQCLLSRGLYPVVVDEKDPETLLNEGITLCQKQQWLQSGDEIVFISGGKTTGSTNTMKVVDV